MFTRAAAIPCLTVVIVLMTSQLVHSQRAPRARKISPGGLVSMALREPIQKELGLDKDPLKVEEIRKLGEVITHEIQVTLKEGKREEGVDAGKLIETIRTKHEAELKRILTLKQYTRLKQISWQQDVAVALSDPEVVNVLGITSDQEKKISILIQESAEKRREKQKDLQREAESLGLQSTSTLNANAKLGEIVLERDKQLQELLSKTQQKRFGDLKGVPFDSTKATTKNE